MLIHSSTFTRCDGSVRLPEEFVTKEVIPYLRLRLVHYLFHEKHVSQNEIARLLWIKQPTVSKILKESPRKEELEQYLDIHEVNSFITSAARNLLAKKWNARDFITAMQAIIWKSLMGGGLCTYHKMIYPELKKINCDACFQLLDSIKHLGKEKVGLKQSLKQCYEKLKNVPEIIDLIPEVRTNIVVSSPKAQTLEDVLAFPGRITAYKGSLKIVDEPEFGASKHLGSLLLLVQRHFPEITCGTCIRHDFLIQETISKVGGLIALLPRTRSTNNTFMTVFNQALMEIKNRNHNTPLFLVDPGSVGLEPVTYIFHDDIDKMTELLISIAKAMHKND